MADMAGNVWEWTASDFDKGSKSVRGASFDLKAEYLRAALRIRFDPDLRLADLGFRCAGE
jgi:formylglycine-generating enzyme required for sulfatase activity